MDWPATLTALTPLVTAVGVIIAVILGYVNRRSIQAAKDKAEIAATAAVTAKDKAAEAAQTAAEAKSEIIAANAAGQIIIGRQLDGRLTELLASQTARARAEGIAVGEQQQRDRAAPPEGSAPSASLHREVHEVTIVNPPGDPVPVVSTDPPVK